MTSKMKDLTTIFVYGTLKRNEPNHHLMIERNAQFISEGSTVKIWPLIVTTERNVPYLLDTNKVGKKIKGEIYKVDRETLQFLDEFEGVHLNMYSSKELDIEAKDGSINSYKTYVLENFNENFFFNEKTVLIDNYTETKDYPYRKRTQVPNFNLDNLLKQIKNL